MSLPAEVVYLDDMCIIGWLNSQQNDPRTRITPEQAAHIGGILEDARRGEIHLVFSVVHRTSVERMYGGDGGFFDKLRRWRHTTEYVPSPRDYTFAGELCERTRIANQSRSTNKTHVLDLADAWHLAFAIASNCHKFLTHEDKLIRLYSEGVITELKICEPISDRLPLDFSGIEELGVQQDLLHEESQ